MSYNRLAMLLFKKPFWAGLQSGAITLTFRRWARPHVRPGGRYRCHPIGVLEVDELRLVPVKGITAADAQRAGFETRQALVAYLAELGPLTPTTQVYRVASAWGDGDRVELALETALTAEDREAIGQPAGPRRCVDRAHARDHRGAAADRGVEARAAARPRDPAVQVDVRKLKSSADPELRGRLRDLPRGRAYLEGEPADAPAPRRRAR